MRWQIPLIASFALSAAVGCNKQPLEPTEATDSVAADIHPSENHARITRWEETYEESVCGYDDVEFHGIWQETWRIDDIREGIPHHYFLQVDFRGSGIGQNTGQTWKIRLHERESYMIQWDREWEDRANIETGNWHYDMIGQGNAPNFKGRVSYRLVRNGNGDLVIYLYDREPTCD